MNIEIINIGDELLIGQVVNTNCSYMAKVLNNNGMNVSFVSTINDNPTKIEESVLLALQRTDCVLITGGLGPTKDDMTKHCLCKMFGGKLILNEQVSKHVEQFFLSRNLPYTDTNKEQALVPDCCQVIFNPIGTAPGMVFEKNNKLVISMPGVPFEMQNMMNDVIPILIDHYKTETIIHHSIMVAGISESFLSDRLEQFEASLDKKDYSLAYLPKGGIITLRLSYHSHSKLSKEENAKKKEEFNQKYQSLKLYISEYLVSEDDKTIAAVVGEQLLKKHLTLSTAESCTGGNIAHQLTLISGASAYFKGSIVSYCNEIKHKILGVKQETLDTYSAVSEQTAKEMALGAIKTLNTDYSIATTGLAGPNGDGSATEVGTVYIAIANSNGDVAVHKTIYHTSRENFIDRTTNQALFFLLEVLRK